MEEVPAMNIYTILSSMKHNKLQLNRYLKFIDWCAKTNINGVEFAHLHHICPKSMFPIHSNLTVNKWNGIKLTYRQHYIAHLMLTKVYPKSIKMTMAFICMNASSSQFIKIHSKCYANNVAKLNGQVIAKNKITGEYEHISSEEYAKGNHTHNSAGMVAAIDAAGNTIKVTSEKFNSTENLKGVKANTVSVIFKDNSTGHVTKEQFDSNDELVGVLNGKVYAKNNESGNYEWITPEIYSKGGYTHFNKGLITGKNKITGDVERITSEEYAKGNHTHNSAGMVAISLNDGTYAKVTKEEFNKGDYKGVNSGYVIAKNKITGESKRITSEEYFLNCDYTTHHSGTVIAKNKITGDVERITSEEYAKGNHTHSTSGTVTAKNKITGDIERITSEEYAKGNHTHDNKNMVTVVLDDGTYAKVTKEEFNKGGYKGVNSGKCSVRSIHKIGSYRIPCGALKDYEVTVYKKIVYVHNNSTNEEKILSKNEFVDEKWKLGKLEKN